MCRKQCSDVLLPFHSLNPLVSVILASSPRSVQMKTKVYAENWHLPSWPTCTRLNQWWWMTCGVCLLHMSTGLVFTRNKGVYGSSGLGWKRRIRNRKPRWDQAGITASLMHRYRAQTQNLSAVCVFLSNVRAVLYEPASLSVVGQWINGMICAVVVAARLRELTLYALLAKWCWLGLAC